jgi:hypothetical protein
MLRRANQYALIRSEEGVLGCEKLLFHGIGL